MSQHIAQFSKTVSAATASGVLTVDETASLWPGTFAWLSKAAVTSQRVQIVEIVSATTLRVRIVPQIDAVNFAKAAPVGYPNMASSDLSGFTGGSATLAGEAQVVGSNADGTRLPSA